MNISKEYIAGFFDGEGCIYIAKDKKGTYRLTATFTQKDPTILGWILINYPEGFLYKNGEAHKLIFDTLKAKRILNDIKDFCIGKKEQILIGLEFLDLIKTSNNKLDKDEKVLRESMFLKLKELKIYKTEIQ